MIELLIVLVGAAIVFACFHAGVTRTTIVVGLFSMILVPRALFALIPDGGALHVGISSFTPAVTTYGLAVMVGVAVLALRWGFPREVLIWIPFMIWLVVGWSTEWAAGPVLVSGLMQYALGIFAWVFGATLGQRLIHSADVRRLVCTVVLIALSVQVFVVVLQAVGIPINPMSASNLAQLPGRFNGTLGHPNDLGKVVILVLVVALPLHATRQGVTFSRQLLVTLGSGFLVLFATGGRAVTVGAAVMVLFWVLLQPGLPQARTHKARALVAALVGGGAIAIALAGRFEEDPTGGARGVLSELATQQIALRPLWGTGPNQYVEVVGAFDALTASGVPVHNSFLLAVAELGIPGAVLLSLPFVVVILKALFSIRSTTERGVWGRVIVAACPALIVIGATGWGLLGSYVFPLLCLAFGAAAGSMRREPRAERLRSLDADTELFHHTTKRGVRP
ncbi:hypothetical protein E1I21_02990 [Microbacterium oleivorans]|uniref:O-antigen ligase family protein n=1 Tax=Microbacterium oleivorans TaxID=273677 RepID=UPI0010A460B9|nr:O-antigen ligase family protein [Microbacterium oleivorans]THE08434.1 hypothetical protein E1I21_02990 [Microbacterium oleivorans]